MRRIVPIVLCFVVAGLFIGHAGKSEARSTEVVVALHTSAEGIEAKTVEAFKALVDERTKGELVVKVFAGGALGSEQENINQIKSGEIQMCVFGDVMTAQLLKEYNATAIPFVFPDIEAAEKYWNSISGDVDKLLLERNNMKILGRQRRAPRQLTANEEIHTPADLKGLKLRVPGTPFFITVWKSLGAIATPVNWSEIYTALQTHVVEAQENPIETYYTAKLHEVQAFTMLTSHINTHYTWTVNARFFDKLSDANKKILIESAAQVLDKTNAELMDRQNVVIEKLKQSGHKFIEVDTKKFQAVAMPGIRKCAQTLAPEARKAVAEYVDLQ